MKRFIFLFILTGSAAFLPLHACDICGGFSGAQSLGLLPSQQQHFIGIRAGTGRFTSTDPFIDNWTAVEKDQYIFTELRGRVVLHPNWQFHAFVPYLFLSKVPSLGAEKIRNQGLGDMGMMLAYRWVLQEEDEQKRGHQLLLSGGVKLPTGKQLNPGSQSAWIPNLQPGTGATDALLSVNYIMSFPKGGIMAEHFTRYTTANQDQYRFGNRFNSNLRAFYKRALDPLGKVKWMPSAGIAHEYLQTDTHYGLERFYSGGTVWNGTLGMDLFSRNYHLSVQYFLPFDHALAKKQVRPQSALQISVSYLINNQ